MDIFYGLAFMLFPPSLTPEDRKRLYDLSTTTPPVIKPMTRISSIESGTLPTSVDYFIHQYDRAQESMKGRVPMITSLLSDRKNFFFVNSRFSLCLCFVSLPRRQARATDQRLLNLLLIPIVNHYCRISHQNLKISSVYSLGLEE